MHGGIKGWYVVSCSFEPLQDDPETPGQVNRAFHN